MSGIDIAAWFQDHDSFLVAAHTNPDGDAIGSMFAAGHILKAMGKQVALYNASGLPDVFAWLKKPAPMISSLSQLEGLNMKPECCLLLDCGDLERAGEELCQAVVGGRFMHTASIDHHRDNPMYAEINWVEPNTGATAQLVGQLAELMGFTLTGALGEAVYLGISADTGNFSYDNTTPEIFDMAAHIVRQGLKVGDFCNRMNNQWSLARFRAWGELLGRIETAFDGRVAYVVADQTFFENYSLPGTDFSEFSSMLRRVKGASVGLFIRAVGPALSKGSLRSSGFVDVCSAAQALGGGGHRNAAGVEMPVLPRELLLLLLPLLEKAINDAEAGGEV